MSGRLEKIDPLAIPTYTYKKEEQKKILCPTRFLFVSSHYNFIWNEEARSIESAFELPPQAKYIEYIDCVDEYPTEYILTRRASLRPYPEHYARLTMSPVNEATITTIKHHPYIEGERISINYTIICKTRLFSHDKSIKYDVETRLLTDRKTDRKTKLDGIITVYSLQGSVSVLDDSCRAVMIASEFSSKSYTMRKIDDSGLSPVCSTLEIPDWYKSHLSSFLYDGRFVATGIKQQKLFVAFWSPHKKEQFYFFVDGPFGESTCCWQLPSTSADVLDCQDVLTQWTNISGDIIKLITNYVCLSASSLRNGPQTEFSYNVVTKL